MNWNNAWHNNPGPWGWMMMVLMMVVFWGALAWVIVSFVRHGGFSRSGSTPSPTGGVPMPPTGPEDILHERFARGEIDVDEYHQRVDALRSKRPTSS